MRGGPSMVGEGSPVIKPQGWARENSRRTVSRYVERRLAIAGASNRPMDDAASVGPYAPSM